MNTTTQTCIACGASGATQEAGQYGGASVQPAYICTDCHDPEFCARCLKTDDQCRCYAAEDLK
jgi:hypothetical protein